MDEVSYRQRLGQRIRDLRADRGMLAKQLAEIVGVSRPQLSRIESGTRPMDSMLLRRIAQALHVPVDDLFPQERVIRAMPRTGGTDAEHMKPMIEFAQRLREDIDVVAKYAARI